MIFIYKEILSSMEKLSASFMKEIDVDGKNDSIDECGLCSSSESVPKTLDKPVTWYGHRVMQTVLVILLLCYCT